jgi:hypothetical protein
LLREKLLSGTERKQLLAPHLSDTTLRGFFTVERGREACSPNTLFPFPSHTEGRERMPVLEEMIQG